MKAWMILVAGLNLTVNASAATVDARASHRYPITDYGAVPDGTTVNTKAIQAAIEKCASSKIGGVVPPPTPRCRASRTPAPAWHSKLRN